MVTVAVTGAAGFIGGALIQFLRQRGHEVLGVDNYSGPIQVTWPEIPIEHVDLRDPAAFRLLEGADVLLHLAAVSGVMACANDPVGSSEVNVAMTQRLVEWVGARGIPLAFASSFAVVGIPARLPITEATPPNPPHEYARQKSEGEAIIGGLARNLGVAAAVLRMSNVYGRYRVRDQMVAKGNVLNLFAEQARSGALQVSSPGTQRRDYIHLADVLAHWEAVARRLASHPRSNSPEVFDVASGESATVLELAEMVVRHWKTLHPAAPLPEVRVVPNPRGSIEILHTEFEVSRAETERTLGVRCAHTLEGSIDAVLSGADMLGLASESPTPRSGAE